MLGTKQIWVMFLIFFVDVAVTAVIYNIASKFVYSNSIARAMYLDERTLTYEPIVKF